MDQSLQYVIIHDRLGQPKHYRELYDKLKIYEELEQVYETLAKSCDSYIDGNINPII